MAAEEVAATVGIAPACKALGVARSSLYRHRQPVLEAVVQARRSNRALTDLERGNVLSMLHVLSVLLTNLRPRSMRPFWTREHTFARYGPCTASWPKSTRFVNGATSSVILTTRSRNCWLRRRARFGRGISLNCWDQLSGLTFSYM